MVIDETWRLCHGRHCNKAMTFWNLPFHRGAGWRKITLAIHAGAGIGTNGGDDTGASKKYAKAGGSGGSCAEPKTVAFYTYYGNPNVTCTSGHGVTRSATPLRSLKEFTSKGGSLVTGGTSTYDGNPHGVSIGGSSKMGTHSDGAGALSAQADGDEEYNWAEQGSTDVDNVSVSCKVVKVKVRGLKSTKGLSGKKLKAAKKYNAKAKAHNKKIARKYAKFMTKKVVGKKVTVKA